MRLHETLPASLAISIGVAALGTVGAVPAHAQQGYKMDARMHTSAGSCVACDLSRKSMTRLRLVDADFSKSDFTRSNLSGGRFSGTDLSDAVFSKAFLVKASGERVDLSRAVLRDATLTQASLRSSQFSGADMRRVDLTAGVFSDSVFADADMSSSIARGADFSGADMRGARLPMANLSGADFSGADLSGARAARAVLADTRLVDADLSGADLSGALGLTQGQLDTACGNAATRLPRGLYVGYCDDRFPEPDSLAASTLEHDHTRAVARLDTAISGVEEMLAAGTLDAPERLRLQRVHSELVGSRRSLK